MEATKSRSLPNGACLIHELIHDSILSELLLYVDKDTLLKSANRVCRLWRNLISRNNFWLGKCIFDGVIIPPAHLRSEHRFYYSRIAMKRPFGRNLVRNPSGERRSSKVRSEHRFDYSRIAMKRPFGRNLIKNPSGEQDLRSWRILNNGGDGFSVEKPPCCQCDQTGMDGDKKVPIHSCFVTSYAPCSKFQTIDLVKEGIEAWVLDELKPPIEVSEWHAARWDCGTKYRYRIELLDENPWNRERNPPWDLGWDYHDSEREDKNEPTSKGIVRNELITAKRAGREWKKWAHTFSDYPKGVRLVRFWHGGTDTQYWAGHYGAKMSGASVKVSFNDP